MPLPIAADKTNLTPTVDDHAAHHNALAVAVNDDLLRSALSPSVPARVLGTAFQPSTTRPALVSYTAQLSVTTSATTTQSANVQLRCDAANPPTTVRAQAHLESGIATATSAGMALTTRSVLTFLVPIGQWVRLVDTVVGATSTATLVNQAEVVL